MCVQPTDIGKKVSCFFVLNRLPHLNIFVYVMIFFRSIIDANFAVETLSTTPTNNSSIIY